MINYEKSAICSVPTFVDSQTKTRAELIKLVTQPSSLGGSGVVPRRKPLKATKLVVNSINLVIIWCLERDKLKSVDFSKEILKLRSNSDEKDLISTKDRKRQIKKQKTKRKTQDDVFTRSEALPTAFKQSKAKAEVTMAPNVLIDHVRLDYKLIISSQHLKRL